MLLAGVLFGVLSALLATLPSLFAPGTQIPYLTIGFLFLVVLINGGIWTYSAAVLATRGDLISALRNE